MKITATEFGENLGYKIFQVDTGFVRPAFDACYILAQRAPSGDRLAIIDTGTNFSVPRILATIKELGCSYEQVSYVILTHIHLDHAGGAGLLMQSCPNAQLVVHPRGARHVVDPSALRAGAVEVYGEETVEKEYGRLIPVPAKRIIEAKDGQLINLAGRMLTLIETPGHAKHHICIWDELSQGMFTGDTFGLSYREFDTEKGPFVIPTTTPVQFDPKSLKISIKKIMAFNPTCLYLTHYGRVEKVSILHNGFLHLLDEVEALGKNLKYSENRHAFLKEGLSNIYLQALQEHGCKLIESEITKLLELDIELNAQGMGIWLN